MHVEKAPHQMLSIGQRLGAYEITAKLGEGGMGEVYRAVDGKLRREVAIKVLPAAFTTDEERLARFEREAQLLAQLQHPNIASIYGLEDAGGVRGLVMELVEGPTLAERLESGPLPLDEALPVARQITEALEEAHGRGIVHRDLKPQNIKLRELRSGDAGQVKVLDFGLAKAMDPGGTASQPGPGSRFQDSPTLSLSATREGVIMGTAAYMSPEQARGLRVDAQADIWAFGVVLFEMLSGRSLFLEATATDTLASVLRSEIDFSSLPEDTPPPVRRLLRRCLERAPKNRLHHIADARIVLDECCSGRLDSEAPTAAGGPRAGRPGTFQLAAASLLLLFLGGFAGWWLRPSPVAPRTVSRLSISLPADQPYMVGSLPGKSIDISRDGSRVVFVTDSGDRENLVVRSLDEIELRTIATGETLRQPFFSPDGGWIGFFDKDSLQKVSLAGGRPVPVTSGIPNSAWIRGCWSDSGSIVFDTWNTGLRVVPSGGGPFRDLTRPEDEWHLGPECIPDTDTVLFTTQTSTGVRIDAIDLDGSSRRTVLDHASQPLHLASGHLLFTRERALMVTAFDPATARVRGSPVPVDLETMVDDDRVWNPVPQLAASMNGTLVFAPRPAAASAPVSFVWVDRLGSIEPLATFSPPTPAFDLFPGGDHRLALAYRDGNHVQLASYDIARATTTPLRRELLDSTTAPLYSPDGLELYFSRFGPHRGEVFALRSDGGEPRLLGRLEGGSWVSPSTVSRDGRWLLGWLYSTETRSDLWVLDLEADDPDQAARVIALPMDQKEPALSPDGRWLALVTDEGGTYEVFLQSFPGGESRTRVSSRGGSVPRWSPDGRELYFLDGEDALVSLSVTTSEAGAGLELGPVETIADGPFWSGIDAGPTFAVAADGKRLAAVLRPDDPTRSPELVVVQGWSSELRALLSSGL